MRRSDILGNFFSITTKGIFVVDFIFGVENNEFEELSIKLI